MNLETAHAILRDYQEDADAQRASKRLRGEVGVATLEDLIESAFGERSPRGLSEGDVLAIATVGGEGLEFDFRDALVAIFKDIELRYPHVVETVSDGLGIDRCEFSPKHWSTIASLCPEPTWVLKREGLVNADAMIDGVYRHYREQRIESSIVLSATEIGAVLFEEDHFDSLLRAMFRVDGEAVFAELGEIHQVLRDESVQWQPALANWLLGEFPEGCGVLVEQILPVEGVEGTAGMLATAIPELPHAALALERSGIPDADAITLLRHGNFALSSTNVDFEWEEPSHPLLNFARCLGRAEVASAKGEDGASVFVEEGLSALRDFSAANLGRAQAEDAVQGIDNLLSKLQRGKGTRI